MLVVGPNVENSYYDKAAFAPTMDKLAVFACGGTKQKSTVFDKVGDVQTETPKHLFVFLVCDEILTRLSLTLEQNVSSTPQHQNKAKNE